MITKKYLWQKDDRILICTDGLTNYIEPEKIRNLADDMDSVSLADRLVALAKKKMAAEIILQLRYSITDWS